MNEKNLRRAVIEAQISLGAIGHPQPNDPPDAHICAVIARGALIRMQNALDHDDREPDAYGNSGDREDCDCCDGTGLDYGETCVRCGGHGWFNTPT